MLHPKVSFSDPTPEELQAQIHQLQSQVHLLQNKQESIVNQLSKAHDLSLFRK